MQHRFHIYLPAIMGGYDLCEAILAFLVYIHHRVGQHDASCHERILCSKEFLNLWIRIPSDIDLYLCRYVVGGEPQESILCTIHISLRSFGKIIKLPRRYLKIPCGEFQILVTYVVR